MATPEPYQAAVKKMNETMDEMERLLKQRDEMSMEAAVKPKR